MRRILSRGVLASGASFVAAALLVCAGSAAPETAPAAPPNPIRSLSARGADVVERIRTKVIVVRTALSDHHGFATGFLAAPGLVLTSAHAVSGLNSAVIWVNG